MAMKRLREEEEDSSCEEDLDSRRTADFLLLLSRGDGDGQEAVELPGRLPTRLPGRVFECKTCNRQFSSFQALGGHRASHKKPRMVEDYKNESPAKAKVHECSICGLEFAIGQALGGHMRRHRIINTVEGFPVVKKSISAGNKKVFLDLNLPPSEAEQPELGFGIGLVPMMSFVH